MNILPDEVSKYLAKYAFPDWNLETNDSTKINAAVIIPAISEFDNLTPLLSSLSENDDEFLKNTIIIFVINNVKSSNIEIKKDNSKSLNFLRHLIVRTIDNSENSISEKIITSQLRIGLIDASTEGKVLPEKEGGVGFARKIGMDLALRYFDYSNQSKKLLISLDADCTVDENYISEIIESFSTKNIRAAVINYKHKFNDPETARAIVCYEIFLRYYVLGLKFADSPFAFHSIGSTIVCDYESYIKTRGMNKKNAAEDFYFLEKLAKYSKIHKITSTNVYPSSRPSWRVPFGTGQRVNRFLSNIKNEYLLYNPKSFFILKEWLIIFHDKKTLPAKQYLEETQDINKHLYDFLLLNNFEPCWKNILLNSKTDEQIDKQKINWFDGFKTLKLIHYLRDKNFPLINMFDVLDEMLNNFNTSLNFNRKKDIIPKIGDQRLYLEQLRRLT